MRDRATYSMGDSLDAGHKESCGWAGDKPTCEGMSFMYDYEEAMEVVTLHEQYKSGEISFADYWEEVCNKCQNGYIEAQYHGRITIEDVERVVFSDKYSLKDSFNGKKGLEAYKRLRELGVQMKVFINGKTEDAIPYIEEALKLR